MQSILGPLPLKYPYPAPPAVYFLNDRAARPVHAALLAHEWETEIARSISVNLQAEPASLSPCCFILILSLVFTRCLDLRDCIKALGPGRNDPPRIHVDREILHLLEARLVLVAEFAALANRKPQTAP